MGTVHRIQPHTNGDGAVRLRLPADPESEQGLLGAVMVAEEQRVQDPTRAPDVIAQVGGLGLAGAFSQEALRQLWELLCRRHQAGLRNGLVEVYDAARAEQISLGVPASDLASWAGQVSELWPGFPALADRYAATLRECAERRRLLRAHFDVLTRLQDDRRPLTDWYCAAASAVADVTHLSIAPLDLGDDVLRIMRRVEELVESGRAEIVGVASGIPALDNHLGGFRPGDLVVVGGRPSTGKSALGTTIALNVSQALPVVYASLEMPRAHLTQRLLSQISGVPLTAIWRGPVRSPHYAALTRAAAHLSTLPIRLMDDTYELGALLGRLQQQVHLGARCVVIDYLGLVQTEDRRLDGWERIGVVTRECKLFAKRMDVPVLLLAQLNRESAKDAGKRPSMIGLRGSGSIEQDADVIILIHREGASDPRSTNTHAELIVDKFRNGPTGVVAATWCRETARFEGLGEPTEDARYGDDRD